MTKPRNLRLKQLLQQNREADRRLAELIGKHIDKQSDLIRKLQDDTKQLEERQ